MILSKERGHKDLRDCLLIVPESCIRYLYLLTNEVNQSHELLNLHGFLMSSEFGFPQMITLCLIEPKPINANETQYYEVTHKGFQLIEFAERQAVAFHKLTHKRTTHCLSLAE